MFFENQNAGYAVLGNAALRPESSTNVTAGAEWGGERVYARAQLFWNRFRDFIETRPISAPDEPPVYQYGNVDDGVTRGDELELGTAIGALRAEGAYGYLATENAATGQPLLGRPTHTGRLSLTYTAPFRLRAGVTGLFTGRTPMQRDPVAGAITSERDPFTRLDVRLAQALPWGLEAALGVDNIFDARPDRWPDFTGRHIYTALSWTLHRTTTP